MSVGRVSTVARWTAADGGLSHAVALPRGADRFARMLAHVVAATSDEPTTPWIVATTLGPVADGQTTAPTVGDAVELVAQAVGHRARRDIVNAGPATVAMTLVHACARGSSEGLVVAFVDVATARYDGAAVALRLSTEAEAPVALGRPTRRELEDAWALDAGLREHPLAAALALAGRLPAQTNGWAALELRAGADGRRWCIPISG